ncbi:uncharacterized protein LOC119725614 [Patiria miniata]|uniref:Carbohydrate sulfotransferase n=1 Tax=Patiria miniata TaxID=46514 RepID=A0A913ZPG8_PATMI|nr:uncharacterized protein LOC119725614 [Patiria miniata]
MRVPKLTRTRFILLWGAGVVLFFLISWKSYFKSGEKVQSGQYVASERKSSDNAQIPGWNANVLDAKVQVHQGMQPPSSVLDARKPKLDAHQDPNIIELERPDVAKDINGIPPPLEDDGRLRPDAKIPNRLNHNYFLAVPRQETDDDSKSFSRDEGPDDEDSSTQSSDVSSQDDQNAEVVVKRENPAQAGLFDDNNRSVPRNSPFHQDEEKDKVALATVKPSKEGLYEKKIHQPQNALLFSESQKDVLPHQKQNPPQPPQDAQTLPKVFHVDRNDGRIDVPYTVPTYSTLGVVPKDRMTNEVSQDMAKSSDSGLLNKEHVHYPSANVSQDELDKWQRQVLPSGVLHGEMTDAVATASEAGKIPVVNRKPVDSQPPRSRFAESNNPVSHEEPKQLVPVFQPHGGRRDQVAKDTVMPNEERIPHPPPDTQLDEHIVVTKKPIRAGFHKDGETLLANASEHLERENTKVVPDISKSSDDSKFHSGLNLANVANRDPSLSNVIMNQPGRDDNIAYRIPGRNLPRKITIQKDGRPVPPNAAQLRSGLELRQSEKPVVSREIQVNSHKSTGLHGKVVPPENESEEEFMQRMETVQRERRDRIRQQCQTRYNLTPLDYQRDRQKILLWKKYYEHAYANDDHQFIICRELKAASFSWRKVMISLYTKGSLQFRRSQKMGDFPIRDYDDETFMFKLQNYKKILFVREPFARFLSAYRDKYVELRHFPYYRPIGMSIIQKYRKNPTPAEIQSGRPTFEEFTRWVVAEEVPEGDFHWRPLFNWAHPCHISYDFIGKVETATEDTKYIFKMVGIDKLETFPSTETHHKFSSSADVLEEFYSQLPPDLLPQLVNRYKEEFELFDYPIPQKISDIWTKR